MNFYLKTIKFLFIILFENMAESPFTMSLEVLKLFAYLQ